MSGSEQPDTVSAQTDTLCTAAIFDEFAPAFRDFVIEAANERGDEWAIATGIPQGLVTVAFKMTAPDGKYPLTPQHAARLIPDEISERVPEVHADHGRSNHGAEFGGPATGREESTEGASRKTIGFELDEELIGASDAFRDLLREFVRREVTNRADETVTKQAIAEGLIKVALRMATHGPRYSLSHGEAARLIPDSIRMYLPVDRGRSLGHLLESDPAAAASLVLAGITEPTTDHAWRRVLVIAAEGIRFTDEQDGELMPALRTFIDEFRDSNDREDQIAVCSAIRTYIGLIPTTQIESVARLLEPGHRASPALDTVLETVKMIARKFAANPPSAPNRYPELSVEVERVAHAYLNPYILPHGKNAAVAMNAVQALVSLAAPGIPALIAEVNAHCPAWFRQQLQRRLRRLVEQWEKKLGSEATDREPLKVVEESINGLQAD